jgi:hypothetical protein
MQRHMAASSTSRPRSPFGGRLRSTTAEDAPLRLLLLLLLPTLLARRGSGPTSVAATTSCRRLLQRPAARRRGCAAAAVLRLPHAGCWLALLHEPTL